MNLLAIGEGLIELGLHQHSDGVEFGYGGDVANVAVMAARGGLPAQLLTMVGQDALGQRLLSFWAHERVGLIGAPFAFDAPTGLYSNQIDEEGVHGFDYYRRGSAACQITPAMLEPIDFNSESLLVVSGVTLAISRSAAATTRAAVDRIRAAGGVLAFALNVRPRLDPPLDAIREMAEAADVVFASTDDLDECFATRDVRLAATHILRRPEDVLVVTDGARGATAVQLAGTSSTAAPTVRAVDAAGAGDCLAGAFLAARHSGATVARALQLGVVAGALSCTRRGCAASYPQWSDVLGDAESPKGQPVSAGPL